MVGSALSVFPSRFPISAHGFSNRLNAHHSESSLRSISHLCSILLRILPNHALAASKNKKNIVAAESILEKRLSFNPEKLQTGGNVPLIKLCN